jgi:hypothetical protein
MRTITSVKDKNGSTQESNASIMRTFTEHMKEKYDSRQGDADQIKIIMNTLHIRYQAQPTDHRMDQ